MFSMKMNCILMSSNEKSISHKMSKCGSFYFFETTAVTLCKQQRSEWFTLGLSHFLNCNACIQMT